MEFSNERPFHTRRRSRDNVFAICFAFGTGEIADRSAKLEHFDRTRNEFESLPAVFE